MGPLSEERVGRQSAAEVLGRNAARRPLLSRDFIQLAGSLGKLWEQLRLRLGQLPLQLRELLVDLLL